MSRAPALPFGLAAAALLACARPYSPPGGEPDEQPPRVVATTPERMAVVPGFEGAVVFRFNERISEEGIERAVLVSPETGAVEVDKGRSDLSVSLEGGWRPDQIYRIVIRPVLRDLFGNTTEQSVDLIFSTGPPIPATALAGVVTDRITGRAAVEARVEAIRRADSTVYVAVADTGGVFALRHIPAGAYDLRAYVDSRPNREPDFTEPIDTGEVALGTRDTVVTTFNILPPDTTSARLVRAEAEDSLAIRLVLDDYLDPASALGDVRVTLRSMPDSTAIDVAEVIHAYVYERRVAAARAARAAADSAAAAAAADSARAAAVADSLATAGAAADSTGAVDSAMVADSAAMPEPVPVVDSVVAVRPQPAGDSIVRPDSAAVDPVAAAARDPDAAAAGDSVTAVADSIAPAAGDARPAADTARVRPAAAGFAAVEPTGARGEGTDVKAGGVAADTLPEPLPSRDLVVVPAEPLEPGASFLVVLDGVRNIAGLSGGGGTATFEAPVPPPDTVSSAADTAGAATDAAGAAPDTTSTAPDTVGVPPDTVGTPPDTTGAPPDTAGTPPDTVSTPPDTAGVPPDTAGA